jgi:hypothetical protein
MISWQIAGHVQSGDVFYLIPKIICKLELPYANNVAYISDEMNQQPRANTYLYFMALEQIG